MVVPYFPLVFGLLDHFCLSFVILVPTVLEFDAFMLVEVELQDFINFINKSAIFSVFNTILACLLTSILKTCYKIRKVYPW